MATLLDDIKDGDILGVDVRNLHGQILLRAGCRLQTKQLRVLRMWGIHQVVLQGEAPAALESGALSREDLERIAVIQRRRFRHCDLKHPAMHQLFMLATRRAALSEDSSNDSC